MSLLKSYKPGQAKLTRTVAWWSGAFFVLWGGKAMVETLPEFYRALGTPLNVLTDKSLNLDQGWTADVIIMQAPVSIAFVVAVLFIAGGLLWWQRFINTERWAELLIDTEGELRKVSWPTLPDAWQSTLIVTACTALLVGLVLVFDWVINGFMRLFGGGV